MTRYQSPNASKPTVAPATSTPTARVPNAASTTLRSVGSRRRFCTTAMSARRPTAPTNTAGKRRKSAAMVSAAADHASFRRAASAMPTPSQSTKLARPMEPPTHW
jgi:hypothetical protein